MFLLEDKDIASSCSAKCFPSLPVFVAALGFDRLFFIWVCTCLILGWQVCDSTARRLQGGTPQLRHASHSGVVLGDLASMRPLLEKLGNQYYVIQLIFAL